MKAYWRRWTKAVDRMTPVPKCLPMKKRMLGTRMERYVVVRVGKETAVHKQNMNQVKWQIYLYHAPNRETMKMSNMINSLAVNSSSCASAREARGSFAAALPISGDVMWRNQCFWCRLSGRRWLELG